MIDRRSVIAGLGLALGCAVRPVRAQAVFPARPITLIVPFAAGGTTDVIARVVAEHMAADLGQPVIIDNRAGAGGALGTAQVAKAAPDGYTIGMGTASTLAINPAAYRSLPFDVLTDLAPVGAIAAVPNVMSINAAVDARDINGFIALARAQKGRLNYGSSGNGSVSHLMGEQFKLATGTDIVHAPYRGIGPALNDVVSGQIEVLFDNLPTTLPLVQSGKLRALAVSGAARVAALPQVPTFAEVKLDDLNWMAFFGLIAPARTPKPVVARLNAALNHVLMLAPVRERLAELQATVVGGEPAQFAADIRRELARMRRATTAAKIEIH